MNYLAHSLFSNGDPYFLAGTSVPDWLAAADRRVRLRARRVEEFLEDADPVVAVVAQGVLRHLHDDAWFHANVAFGELTWELSVKVRRVVGNEGFGANYIAHLLVEVLLDAALAAEDPSRVQCYYQTLEKTDPRRVEAAVGRMAVRPTRRLAPFIRLFLAERILWDYLEDGRLMVRLNQVMRRVHLPPLPESFTDVLPDARQQVTARKAELLEGTTCRSGSICSLKFAI
ncbi:MAG: hypothetical protein JXB10_20100 [Pirellulales bacterium]|nr:hypothetical protein [Pirellulales bacterium]